MKYTVFSKLNCFDHEIKQKEEAGGASSFVQVNLF